jgi:hypothetical protein
MAGYDNDDITYEIESEQQFWEGSFDSYFLLPADWLQANNGPL